MKSKLEISLIKLRKTYGRYATDVLARAHPPLIKWKRKGWYEVEGELPDSEGFKAMTEMAFKVSIGDILGAATGEIESLKDELQDWHDGLPENLQSSQKADDLQTAIDALDNCTSMDLEVPEAIAHLEALDLPHDGDSRSDRGSAAGSQLRSVADAVEEWLTANPEHEDHDDIETFRDEVNNCADELDGVEFPGMY